MALQYSFPSAIYKIPPVGDDLDEIKINQPVPGGGNQANNTATFAEMELLVKSPVLNNVVVRITMMRHLTFAPLQPGGTNPVSPTGPAWGFDKTNVEAIWTRQILVATGGGNPTVFKVDYTPTQAGTYTYSFSVDASELRQPALTQVDVTIA